VKAFAAGWVAPVSAPWIRDGAVAVRDGRIAEVGPREEVLGRIGRGAEVEELPGCVLLPGLVNAHAHIEYTAYREVLDGLLFFDWIRRLTGLKHEVLERDDLLASARLGALEALLAGTTTLAEQTDVGTSVTALREAGLRSICYLEVFGQRPEDAPPVLEELRRRLREAEADKGPRTRLGVTPHTPWTSGRALIAGVAELAAARDLHLSIHVAESLEEDEFVRHGRGILAEHWKGRGFTWEPFPGGPVAYLEDLGFWRARPPVQAVHLVQARQRDWETLAGAGASAALCPRSNAVLGVGRAPVAAARASGLAVGLGTDSPASGGTMGLLDEARAARLEAAPPSGPPTEQILRWLTLDGARCLGLDGEIGSLERGKAADLAAFRLDEPGHLPVHDPGLALVLRGAAARAELVAVEGEVLVRQGRPTEACGLDRVRVGEQAEVVGAKLREAVKDDG